MQTNARKLKLHQPARYSIGVQGVLDASWFDMFTNLTVTCDAGANVQPITVLTGQMLDQAMLVGVLNSLYGLGLCLLWVECLENLGVDQAHKPFKAYTPTKPNLLAAFA